MGTIGPAAHHASVRSWDGHVRKKSLTKGILERETGFEPATSTLARSHSTN